MKKSLPLLVVIAGPTAIGKTSISIELANHYQTEIISADSRQFFKEMSIGTAKPTEQELASAPHHFVDFISIEVEYTAGDFERDALNQLDRIFQDHPIAFMVGGSGLYIDAVCKGLDDLPKSEPIRKQLNDELKNEGIEPLQEKLKKLDPIFYEQIDLQNPQRLIRALEVCMASGKPYSSFRSNEKKIRPFDILKIALTADREKIYSRINQRVEKMIETGLLEEAKKLYAKRHFNALNTVGYKELFEWMDGNLEKEEAISEIKKNTRRFAKRQLTWLRKDPDYNWIDVENKEEIIPLIENHLQQKRQNKE